MRFWRLRAGLMRILVPWVAVAVSMGVAPACGASNQRQALRDILEMTDPKAFLAKSGWYPGIQLR
jgi:hypothetical protein